MDDTAYTTYLAILQGDLIPALGCTEPIAVALAGAKAREVLGSFPARMEVACSGNIVKNVAGVVVPASGGHKGLRCAAILGALSGDPGRGLQVLEAVSDDDRHRLGELLASDFCDTRVVQDDADLLIRVCADSADGHRSFVEIRDDHTHFSRIERDGEILLDDTRQGPATDAQAAALSVEGVLRFAETLNIDDVRELFDQQIELNEAISREGLETSYGASVGKTLIETHPASTKVRATALAAAGSDARMSGCLLPVIINSGSGNQGITASIPVIEYAREMGVSQTRLYRALAVSNLIAIHIKSRLGKLSAFCGAVCAACGSAAAVTWLLSDGDRPAIERTITNTLVTIGGMFCDGAKPSCAAKVASSLEAALLASDLALHDRSFQPGEGIVQADVEATIEAIGRLGREAMRPTDEAILNLMVQQGS